VGRGVGLGEAVGDVDVDAELLLELIGDARRYRGAAAVALRNRREIVLLGARRVHQRDERGYRADGHSRTPLVDKAEHLAGIDAVEEN